MGYFPLSMDIQGRTVLLVGRGPQTDAKYEKMNPFGPVIRRLDGLTAADLTDDVAFVVIGDLPMAQAREASALCQSRHIPVNVVDRPALCTFFFPAMVTRGALTVSVSTGGRTPGAAAYLARQIGGQLPDRMEEILDWLFALRGQLYEAYPAETARKRLAEATRRAFSLGRPLTDEELAQ